MLMLRILKGACLRKFVNLCKKTSKKRLIRHDGGEFFKNSQKSITSVGITKKTILSRKLPEKSSRGYTNFIFEIEPPTCEETLYTKFKKY
jgi:hypothetical protein